jgi:hypothetical protein
MSSSTESQVVTAIPLDYVDSTVALPVKAKRFRKLKAAADPLAVVVPKAKRVRQVKAKPVMRSLVVNDDDSNETFDIPATFVCSSCRQSHSIAEHLQALTDASKIYQTCQTCREKGIKFYRRQKILPVVITAVDGEGASADVGRDSVPTEEQPQA